MEEYEYNFDVTKEAEPYINKVNSTEELYGLPKNMLANLIHTESGFNPEALGPETKYGKAQGITQIIPQFHPDIDPYDPEASIDYAGSKLREYYEEFGSWDAAIASWNAGPTNMRKHGLEGIGKIKGFKETQNYLKKINANRRVIQAQQSLEPNETDEFGGQPAEEADEWGGIPVKEEPETDEFGGQVYEDPRDMKWEKPLPLGQRIIDEQVRPVLQGLGSAAGLIIGGGGGAVGGTAVAPVAGTIAGTAAGGVAGGALGYAMGDEIADLLQEWLGYYEPKPVILNLKEAGKNVVEGLTYEMGGAAVGPAMGAMAPSVVKQGKGLGRIPGVKRATKFVSDMLPRTDKGAKKQAGEILAAYTASGPLMVKNAEEAKMLEDMIPGLKFDLGQLTGDAGVVKFMKEGVDDAGELAAARAERIASNTKAINDFIKKTKGARGVDDPRRALKAIRSMSDEIQSLAKENMERQTTALRSETGPTERGQTIRGFLESGEKQARKKAEELFDKVPEQDQIVDDLIDGFENILKPKHATEGRDKFPKVLRDALEIMKKGGKKKAADDDIMKTARKVYENVEEQLPKETPTAHAYRIARSGKYTPAEARAKADIFYKQSEKLVKEDPQKAMEMAQKGSNWREAAEAMEGAPQHKGWDKVPGEAAEETERVVEPTMTLKDIQGLRSEILEDLRTAKDKNLPRSLRKRLVQAVDLIDKKLGATAETDEVVYHIAKRPYKGGKPDKGAYVAGKRQDGTYTGEDFVEEFAGDPVYGYGEKVHAIVVPKDAKILDLKSGSKDAKQFMKEFGAENYDDMYNFWADAGDELGKKARKLGYEGVQFNEERYFTKELFDRSTSKGVFKPGEIPKTAGKAPSQQLQEAQKFFRENVIEKYGKGTAGRVLRGEETISDPMVADAFFKPGFKGEQTAADFMKVFGDNKQAKQAMKEHINQKILGLRSPQTDEITKASLTRFLRNHQWAIKKLGLGKEYSSLYKARLAADKALAASKEFEKSAASRALNADVNEFIKTAFSKGSKRESAIDMMKQLDTALKPFSKADRKRATKGLQSAFIDEILTEVPLEGTTRELFAADKMASQFRKYDPALKVIFKDNPEKLKAMHAVRKAVKALQYQTGEKAEIGERYAADVFRRMAFLHGHTAVAAVDISRKMIRSLRGISKEKIHKYVNRGILDPEVAYELMQAAKGGSKKKIDHKIYSSLVRLGLIAPQRKEDERSKR